MHSINGDFESSAIWLATLAARADGFDLDATTLFEFVLHRLLDGLAAMVGMGQP